MAQFASPGLCCAKPLFGLANRRRTAGSQQPERYAQYQAKIYWQILDKNN
jgi:hypothetical protein